MTKAYRKNTLATYTYSVKVIFPVAKLNRELKSGSLFIYRKMAKGVAALAVWVTKNIKWGYESQPRKTPMRGVNRLNRAGTSSAPRESIQSELR